MLLSSVHILGQILTEIGSAKSLAVKLMLDSNDFSGFAAIEPKPSHYIDPELYFRDSQAFALFSKCKDLDLGIDKAAVATERWWAAERSCYRSNERLSPFLHQGFLDEEKPIADFLSAVAKKIESWIGFRPPSLDHVAGRFGPGATFADRGALTTAPDKMTSVPTFTSGSCFYLLPYLETMWGRNNVSSGKGLDLVRGNRFATVPKSWKTDRAIAIEPAINVFFQLGLGTAIRRRLRASTGWDLDHAQDIHRREARDASKHGRFATIDLSNASDTVSINLVKLLLPPAWFRELSSLRSPFTQMNGKWVKLEKFSSMGNGYTFELETLIFAALASTWLEQRGHLGLLNEDLFVFGDDIILPTVEAEGFISVLSFCGFETNLQKTFVTGPFKESCGADYWDGFDVRPFFRKEDWSDRLALFPVYNQLYQVDRRLGQWGGSLSSSLELIRRQIPLPWRSFFGPEGLGDSVLHAPENRWKFRWRDSIRYFRALVTPPAYLPWSHWKPEVILACATYGTGDGLRGVIPRGTPFRAVVGSVPYS